MLFSSLCPANSGGKRIILATVCRHKRLLDALAGFRALELIRRTVLDIEKGSEFPDPPTDRSDKSDQKVDNIVAVYNRARRDLTRQCSSTDSNVVWSALCRAFKLEVIYFRGCELNRDWF